MFLVNSELPCVQTEYPLLGLTIHPSIPPPIPVFIYLLAEHLLSTCCLQALVCGADKSIKVVYRAAGGCRVLEAAACTGEP